MKKQFELNGVNVELSKEQLQKMLKDFDKPVWSTGKDRDNDIVLLKDGELVNWLWDKRHSYQENISKLVFKIAEKMGYLASKKQIKDNEKAAFNVSLNIRNKEINVMCGYSHLDLKIIDTKEHAEEIIELIKSNEDLLKYIWMEDK